MSESQRHIELRVPADPQMSRVVRLAASGIASLSVFTIDEIEDIKIAVSEILLALIEHGGGQPVDIRLRADAGPFVIDAITDTDEFDITHPNLVMFETVLSGVCDSHEVEIADGRASIRAIITHDDTATG